MSNREQDYDRRVKKLPELFMELCSSKATVEAMCADGWPEKMVRRGLGMHSQTWNPNAVVHAFERELEGFGGIEALGDARDGARIEAPSTIAHIWPALPGAGVTPVLFGFLLGARQVVRPSSRGEAFARHFASLWRRVVDPSMSIRKSDWWDADVVVVSGSDETVDDVREVVRERASRRASVTGYGHRVSFAVVDDTDGVDLERLTRGIATDIVMWHQKGCFSCRAVFFRGTKARRDAFCEHLGAQIAEVEEALDASDVAEGELARRAQARGTAEFGGPVWGEGVGWVAASDEPWRGEFPSIHSVTVHPLGGVDELATMVDVPFEQLQGVALSCADESREMWMKQLIELGVTRICEPGALQRPSAGWMHDGRPNILDWLRFVDVPKR
ncbi:MAG: acyl-CoA reductase [Myxococcota bacterium]